MSNQSTQARKMPAKRTVVARQRPPAPRPPEDPSRDQIVRAAQDLIREATGIPPRIRGHLDTMKPGLKDLVASKIPVKTISDRFVRKFPWKISQTHLRQYLREEFNYPSAPKAKTAKKAKKAAAKKKPAKVVKKG